MLSRKRKSALLNRSTGLEQLEDRCLLSAAPHVVLPLNYGHGGVSSNSIAFSALSTDIQGGLNDLATTGNFTLPTATTTIYLGNTNGIETYTLEEKTGTGRHATYTDLTVDQNGKVVTPPTASSSTFGLVDNSAVTDEIANIATALNLSTPAATDTVKVLTNADGTATYTVTLYKSTVTTTSTSHGKIKTSVSHRGSSTVITVDSNGDPVGNESVPLSTLSFVIQAGLVADAPAGATALTSTSLIKVKTIDGVNTYTATYTGTGFKDLVTVDDTGAATSFPATTTADFSAIPTPASAEIQILATAAGYTGTIPDTQSVTALTETNGTVIYTTTLAVTTTTSSGRTHTSYVTFTVDQDGDPTVLPNDDFSIGGFGGGRDDGGCHH